MRGKNPNEKGHNIEGRRTPSFSVQDEIKRNRRIERNKRIRQARATRRKAITAFLCISVLLITVCAVLLTVMRVKEVSVSSNSRYSAEEILEAADLDGDILPFVSEEAVYKKIVSVCPYVNGIEIVKKYPYSAEVVVTETEVVYYSYLHGRPYSLDENLRVIEFTENDDGLVLLMLPQVSKAVEGETLVFTDSRYNTLILEILNELFGENALPFVSVDLSNRFSITAAAEGSFKIEFGDYNDLTLKLKAASKLMQAAMEQESERTYINVSTLSGVGPSMILDYDGEI